MPKKKSRKAANGDGSIYPLPNGKFQVAVTIPRSGGKRLKATAPSRDLARVERERLMKEARSGVVAAGKATVGQMVDLFLDSRSFAENTLASYQNARKNIGSLIDRQIGRLTPLEIAEWIVATKQRIGARACELAALTLKRACNYAVELQIIAASPFRSKIPRARPKEIDPFTEAEAARIVQQAIGQPMGGVVVLAIGCGMRQAEIFGLQWGDIDWTNGSLRVSRQVTECKGQQIVKTPKTKRSLRSIILPAVAIEVLRAQQAVCLKAGRVQPEDWVFPSRNGRPFRRTNYAKRHWKPLLRKLRLRPRGLHAGRHTTATLLLMRNIPVTVVAGQLGHSRPSTTHDTYSHYVSGIQRDAAEAMDSVLGRTAVAPKRPSRKSASP